MLYRVDVLLRAFDGLTTWTQLEPEPESETGPEAPYKETFESKKSASKHSPRQPLSRFEPSGATQTSLHRPVAPSSSTLSTISSR